MNRTTRDAIIYLATKEGCMRNGDVIIFEGKEYYVDLSEGYVEFLRNLEDENEEKNSDLNDDLYSIDA